MNPGRRKRRFAGMAAVATAALLAAACSSSSPPPSSSSGAKVTGGTATWAELPGSQPNYVWPFTPITNYSTYNSQGFQWLMYRPALHVRRQQHLDLGQLPAVARQRAGVHERWQDRRDNLKGWKWSDGETVDATDVMLA